MCTGVVSEVAAAAWSEVAAAAWSEVAAALLLLMNGYHQRPAPGQNHPCRARGPSSCILLGIASDGRYF